MREIKFRAWDKQEKEMRFDDFEVFALGDITDVNTNLDITSEVEVMQYTGLKDKNGQEIYEGDIVVAWSEGCSGKFEVRWRQESAPKWILYPAWQSQKFWNLHGSKHEDGHYYDMVEVIGNVFEHPELLEVKEGESNA